MSVRYREQTEFGKQLVRLRERCFLTQKTLAMKAGISYHAVRALECRDEINPTVSTVLQLAKALGVQPVDLLTPLMTDLLVEDGTEMATT